VQLLTLASKAQRVRLVARIQALHDTDAHGALANVASAAARLACEKFLAQGW
jgi:hypothetical protein